VTAQTGLQPDTATPGRQRLGRAAGSERATGRLFELALLGCLGFGLLVLVVLLYDTISTGYPRFNLDLLTNMPSGRAAGRASSRRCWGPSG
jgi:hypothetical protein